MPASKKLKAGETVFGLWPGSGGLYFKGVIEKADPKDGTYDVKFEEGTTYTLLEKHVKSVESFKTVEPKSAQRQVRRRGRSSSASRSRSRSRTPGRKPLLAKKSSPESKKGSPTKEEKPASTEPERRVSARKKLIDDEDVIQKPKAEDNAEEVLRRRSTRVRSPVKQEVVDISFQRRSTRLAEKVKKEDYEPNGLVEDSEPGKAKSTEQKSESSTSPAEDATDDDESTSKFGAFSPILTLLYISLVFYLYLICKQNKCLFKSVSEFNTSDLIDLYNPFISLCVEGFFLSVLIFSKLPIGQFYEVEGARNTRQNGLLVSALTFALFQGLKFYFKISALTILQQVPQFLIPVFVVGFVAAVFVAYNSRTERNETGWMQHFTLGSSVHVALGGVNVKVWIHRCLFLVLFVLNSLAIEADYQNNKTISPTLALTAGMQIVYAVEAILNEKFSLSGFEFTDTKIGWMYLAMPAYSFMTFLTTICITISGHELPTYYLVPIAVLFLIGMFIKVSSNRQKEAFSKSPNNPIFADAETLTGPSGEKILISGWWGALRHPNYLGDVLVHCAFVLSCGTYIILPHLIALFIIFNILYRAIGQEAAGKLKYGPAWDRYCQRVPSRVVPRIF